MDQGGGDRRRRRRPHVENGLFLALEGDEKEPLGQRIIEVPVNAEATEVLRDPHSGFIAYVPVGSLKKGEALAKTKQCALCHGAGSERVWARCRRWRAVRPAT